MLCKSILVKYGVIFLFVISFFFCCDGARILAVFPAPFPSHQSVFRPITQALASRGHEVVIITTDPAFQSDAPANLTEIDVHDVSYELRDNFPVKVTGNNNDIYDQIDKFYDMFGKLFEVQMNTVKVQNLIKDANQHFDLLLIEACVRPALVFSHVFKAPVITMSSLGSLEIYTEYVGVPSHPMILPNNVRQRLKNMTLLEKTKQIYNHYFFKELLQSKEESENAILRKIFGDDVPPLSELKKNVVMLMINVHHIWEDSRPVPPNVVYLGGLHLELPDKTTMTMDLKSYLDRSVHGVVYMSLGSLVVPSKLNNINIAINALGKLPYDVLLKWDKQVLPECPKNVKIMKWIPQRKVLHHPNVKLFITQGGLQSTDEAIVAGVPLIGMPILGDQWYNVEKYLDLKIGLRIDLESVTEEKMVNAVKTVINDKSYKDNINALRVLLYDRPMSSLDQAVWWIEYILRHGKSPHLQSPLANLSVWEYFEIDLLLAMLSSLAVSLFAAVYLARYLSRRVKK